MNLNVGVQYTLYFKSFHNLKSMFIFMHKINIITSRSYLSKCLTFNELGVFQNVRRSSLFYFNVFFGSGRPAFNRMLPIRELRNLPASPFPGDAQNRANSSQVELEASRSADQIEFTESPSHTSEVVRIDHSVGILDVSLNSNRDGCDNIHPHMEHAFVASEIQSRLHPCQVELMDKNDVKKPDKVLNPSLLQQVTSFIQLHPQSAMSKDEDTLCISGISPKPSEDKEHEKNEDVSRINNSESDEFLHNDDHDSDAYDISPLFSTSFHESNNKLMTAHKKKQKKKASSKQSSKSSESDVQGKKRPNYFVAIQITNPQIHRRLQIVQNHVTSQDHRLSAAMIPLPTLHITLLVLYLADSQDVEKAQTALTECRKRLTALQNDPVVFHVSGVDNFRDNIVFANIADGPSKDRLTEVAETVADCFTSTGLAKVESRDFNPHLTIVKLSRAPGLRKRGIKKINPKLYAEVRKDDFGPQTLCSLQLCAMMKPKQSNGYYHTIFEEHFVSESHQESDLLNISDSVPESQVSQFSQYLANDILARAMEAIREEQLHRSRKRKMENDTGTMAKKTKTLDDVVREMEVERPGKIDLVEFCKELSWSFEKGETPDLEQVIEFLQKKKDKT